MRLARTHVVILLTMACIAAPASAQFWGGCVDNLGRAVTDWPNQSLNDIARASQGRDGSPIIEYNPYILASVTAATRRFFYMHECGHHALGQVSSGTYFPIASEQAADCWAARHLVQSGEFSAVELQTVQAEISRSPGDWAHLPGPQRALNLSRCLDGSSRCRTVTVWEPQTTWTTQYVNTTTACTHCGCNYYGCGCLHAYDVITVPQQVPVTRNVPVQKTRCD